ncbi:sensor histidine kinase [Olegusella massiliensis]|uniref:sensor histidine kinase n=1 Tax=Olegusella massiliensis TaxID=1776381 RepID=UPI0023F70F2D|nr:sensor histidine kinase [Olegusella massiliensis]MBS5864730.1 sensor histidine kinase [Coriobacteriaceae bacterium]
MSPLDYLRAHLASTIASLAASVLPFLLLQQMGLEHDPALLISLCTFFFCLLSGLSNYVHEKSFMDALMRLSAEDVDSFASATQLRRPDFAEGEIVWQAINKLAREARNKIGEQQAQTAAYREYIETWVHEIKTPLAAQRLMLENLHDSRLRPYAQELSRVEEYVEQALFFARSSSLENDYLIRQCALDDLVHAAVKSRARNLIACKIHLDFQGLGDSAPIVPCDSKWMIFILGQLIDNAVKYCADTQGYPRVPKLSFSAQMLDKGKANERVELCVADNGCGISQADLPRIFERGFTGENGRQHLRSTGLGLYLAYTLCHKMGLSLRAESLQGSWTKIIIAFPRQGLDEHL